VNARRNRLAAARGLALVSLAALSLSISSRPALAADPPASAPAASPEVTRAEALFQEGKALLEQGSFAEACDRLAKSDTLDPTISTLGLLAGCHEQQGLVATAWKEYRATAKRAEAAGDSRADFARERAAALEARVPKLVIKAPSSGASAVEILRDLERVPAEAIGVDVPVDPGAYEIVARASQKQEFRVTVTLKEGARRVVEVPELRPPGSPPYPGADPAGGATSATPETPKPAATAPLAVAGAGAGASGRSAGQTAAIVAAGVGVLGFGVGLVFGGSALSKNIESTTIQETCSPGTKKCEEGRALRDSAAQAATISTVGFGVGAAGLITSLTLLLLSPDGSSKGARSSGAGNQLISRNVWIAPRITWGEGGAVLVGSF
jgi:hypothetical protein